MFGTLEVSGRLCLPAGTISSVFHAKGTAATIHQQLIGAPSASPAQPSQKAGHPPITGLTLTRQSGKGSSTQPDCHQPSNDLTTPRQAPDQTG